MKREYVVIWRTGNERSFRWHRTNAQYYAIEAINVANRKVAQGFKTTIAHISTVEQHGIPTTYDPDLDIYKRW